MLKEAASLIVRHTVPSRRHLTPELALRLVTPECPLWTAAEDQCPFKDPFWAFYWPGGQAIARYILDGAGGVASAVRGRRVLDVGSGCGAGALAAAARGAAAAFANDIDPYAIAAVQLNAELNKVTVQTSSANWIGEEGARGQFDTVLVGDMFYDEQFAHHLFEWLHYLREGGTEVLIGDPGRLGLTAARRRYLALLARYPLPARARDENHGFSETTLWRLNQYTA